MYRRGTTGISPEIDRLLFATSCFVMSLSRGSTGGGHGGRLLRRERRGRRQQRQVLDGENRRRRIGGNRHQGQLEDFGLAQPAAARSEPFNRVLEETEADTDARDEARFNRVPRLVDAVFQAARFRHQRQRRREQNPRRGLRQLHRADGLLLVVVPEQRQRIAEHDARGVDAISLAVEFGRAGNAAERAAVGVQRLDVQQRVGAFHRRHDAWLMHQPQAA